MEDEVQEVATTFETILANFLGLLPDLIIALIIFVASVYLAGLVRKLVKNTARIRNTDPELRQLLGTVIYWTLLVLGTTAALNQVGFDLTAFLTGLGIVGFTIGFAIQDVSKNFIAGLLLLVQQPFDIGDAIEVAGFGGTVVAVDLRATEMKTFDGRLVQIPNADVFTNAVINYSRADKRRVEVAVGIAYDSDLDLVRETTLLSAARVEGSLEDPAPFMMFNSFGGSAIECLLYFWVDTNDTDPFTAKDSCIYILNEAFRAADIHIPRPAQDLYLFDDRTK
jgi:small-conductance mechanosensitive channel